MGFSKKLKNLILPIILTKQKFNKIIVFKFFLFFYQFKYLKSPKKTIIFLIYSISNHIKFIKVFFFTQLILNAMALW